MWDWTIDTYDWKSYDNPSAILERVRNQSDEQVEVILMHDSSVTVQILPKVIDYLQSQGYKLLPYNPSSHLKVNFGKTQDCNSFSAYVLKLFYFSLPTLPIFV